MEQNLIDIYDLIEHAIDNAFEGQMNLKFYDKFGKGSTFPRVVEGDTLIGGCTETVKYLREQKLV